MPPPQPKPPLPGGGTYLKTIDEDKSDVASSVPGVLKRPARIGSDEGANSVLAETGGARPSQQHKPSAATSRNTAFVALIALVGIVVVVIVIVLLLATGGDDDKDTASPEELIEQTIASVSTGASLRDVNSPQSQARTWLLESDTQLQTITADDEARIQQRYALTVIYFSTNGSQWEHVSVNDTAVPVVFLDPTLNECNWTGVVCQSEVPLSNNMRRRRQRRQAQEQRRYSFDPVVQLILKNLQLSGPLPSETELDFACSTNCFFSRVLLLREVSF